MCSVSVCLLILLCLPIPAMPSISTTPDITEASIIQGPKLRQTIMDSVLQETQHEESKVREAKTSEERTSPPGEPGP